MTSLVSHFWVWLSSALIVGFVTAILFRQPAGHGKIAAWLRWFGLAFAAGLPVAFLHILPGRAGAYLESGLATFAAFLAGCALGALFSGRSLRHHEVWALGLVPAALIWWSSNLFAGRTLEADLKQKVASLVEGAGGDPLTLDIAGRDVLLPSDVTDRAALADKIEGVSGVRVVIAIDKVTGLAATLPEEALAAAVAPAPSADEKEGSAPAGKGPPESPSASKPPAELAAREEPRKNAPSSEEKTRDPAAVLAALPPTGALDATACQAALSATLALEKIQFQNKSASIRRVSTGVMEKLTVLLKRCPNVTIEVGGHTDAMGQAKELSQQRAERVVDYLARMGVGRGRLKAVGYGAGKPVASNDTEEGRAANRRIEFVAEQRR